MSSELVYEYPYDTTESDPTMAVVDATAHVLDTDPADLPQRLNDVINADALNDIITDGADRVEFEFCNHTAVVTPDSVMVY